MGVIHTIIKTSVNDVMSLIDDAIDHRTMSRAEALKFLQDMAVEIDVRIDWVRAALAKDD